MISDAALFGLTAAQRIAEEDENASKMYGGSRPLCVPRVLPGSAKKRQRRTWDELIADNRQIRKAYLEMKNGLDISYPGRQTPICRKEPVP